MRTPTRILATLGVLASVSAACAKSAAPPAGTADFSAHWHDGKAELDGYRLTVERYGSTRSGRAVAIYVTEPFSRSKHVKLDDPSTTPADAVDVLKLNLTRDFQTGIYDYRTMTSLFVTSAEFAPLKLAFSSSEWCGQVYEQLDVRDSQVAQRVASYFEGESADRTLAHPANGVFEDNLFVLLRGLRGPYLAPGERRTVPFLASPFFRRLAHRPATWADASIERLARAERVVVPAGTYAADVYVVRPGDGREGRFHVESAYPHRIVRWAWKAAAGAAPIGATDTGELTGSMRLDYWRTHNPGDERLLAKLGVPPVLK